MLDRLPPCDTPSLILVVDDEPKNIQVVGSVLLKKGHEIIAANSGAEALSKLESIKPDLILLDVMMPGMTGFELCRILKDKPSTRDIPIVFLSAATDKNFVLEALGQGGVDYITKPFHSAELLSRIELHANLKKTRQRLATLIEEKSRLLEIVAHELKNPLNGIQFAAMLLAEQADSPDPQQAMLCTSIRDSATRAFEIISKLIEVRGMEEVKSKIRREPVCLKETSLIAIQNLEQLLQNKDIQLDFDSPPQGVKVFGDHRSLLCCIENLISNAIKFSPKGARVAVRIMPLDIDGEFRIDDEGPGIREDEIDQLFQKFSRLSARPTGGESSTGLGLHIVNELISAMQGTIQYEQSHLGGACFSARIPLVR
jgi:two-component system, sensor histidine kinase and response regulator